MKETIVILQYINNEKNIEKGSTKFVFHGDIKINVKDIEKQIDTKDKVVLIPEFIFLDDNIRAIKQKIFNTLDKNKEFKNDIIIEEILLTSEKQLNIDVDELYDSFETIENANEYLYGLLTNIKDKDKKQKLKTMIEDNKKFDYKTLRTIFKEKNLNVKIETPITTVYSKKLTNFVTANPFLLENELIGKITEKDNFNINNDNTLFVDTDKIKDSFNGIPVYNLNLLLANDIIEYFNRKKWI